jgi:hypothetical protein
MDYQTVGMCLGENLRLLNPFGSEVVPQENQVMWNLSNAVLHLSMAVEHDLAEIQRRLNALEQKIDRLSRSR